MKHTKRLLYYCHRLRHPDPEVQQGNHNRADRRYVSAYMDYAERGVLVWAPWLDLATRGVDEAVAWAVIKAAIAASDGILLDLDGADESHGMRRERELAERLGKSVETMAGGALS
jgi:hypothetical protein